MLKNLLVAAVFAVLATSAHAQVVQVPCAPPMRGMCEQRPVQHHRRPVAVRPSPVVVGAQVRSQTAAYTETRRAKPVVQAEDGRCLGGAFDEVINKCIKTWSPGEIAKIMPLGTKNDSECKGKPIGHTYETDVIGPKGENITVEHTCGRRSQ